MSRGRIEKALSGFYYVNTGAETLQCRARGKFRREGMSPLVGDWVQVRDLGGGEGFVEAVEPRRNVFSRPAAANIDQLVILASAAIPVTEPYLIDRIAAIAALKGCQAHCSVIPGPVNVTTYKKLGIQLTCEPQYQTNKLYHR